MLRQDLYKSQINALKSGEKDKLNILRFVLSQIKNKEIEKREELNDEEVINVIRKIVKELRESIEAFKKGGREDLKQEYARQLEIVSVYLPKEMSEDELKKEIEKIVKENNETYQQNPKTIIGVVMKQLRSRVDSQKIMKVLTPLISKP